MYFCSLGRSCANHLADMLTSSGLADGSGRVGLLFCGLMLFPLQVKDCQVVMNNNRNFRRLASPCQAPSSESRVLSGELRVAVLNTQTHNPQLAVCNMIVIRP